MQFELRLLRLLLLIAMVTVFAGETVAQSELSGPSPTVESSTLQPPSDELNSTADSDYLSTQSLMSPDAVMNQLQQDQYDSAELFPIDRSGRWDEFKSRLKERRALDIGIDYNVLGLLATDSLGADEAAGGVWRTYGQWDLVSRDTPNTGSLVFKLESRHKFTSVSPLEFGPEVGYAGLTNTVYSDQNWRATHLYWQQQFNDGKAVSFIGFLDITDYVDVYAMASPWTGFSNLAFETGSGTIAGLPDGALGAMVGGFLNDHIYVVANIVDANSDATDLLNGFDTFFNQFETFKSLEVGWTTAQDRLFIDNAHLTFWQIDEREAAGTPDGWGVSFSITQAVRDKVLLFARGGWSEDGASLYETSVSAGLGYQRTPGQGLFGLGLNWSRPNADTFGPGLTDQFTMELFQRLEVTEKLQLTPSLQVIGDPALNPDDDGIAIFGLRARFVF